MRKGCLGTIMVYRTQLTGGQLSRMYNLVKELLMGNLSMCVGRSPQKTKGGRETRKATNKWTHKRANMRANRQGQDKRDTGVFFVLV